MSLAVLVAVGSYSPSNKKAEKLENGSWSVIEDAPVDWKLYYYAVTFDADNFYYFGGRDNSDLSSILRLSAASWNWSNVGNLNSARRSHGVILVENTFMVIGGLGTQANEACLLNNGQFTCQEKTSSLNRYASYPLLFLVNDDYKLC